MLEQICESLRKLAEADPEVQMRVDDLVYEQFGDGKSTADINNQGIPHQFERLAEVWGLDEAIKAAGELLEEFTRGK